MTKPISQLGNRLALRFMQEVGRPEFVLSATLDTKKPRTITNFGILATLLEKVYDEGRTRGREDAANICNHVDKSTHPSDLADMIRTGKIEYKVEDMTKAANTLIPPDNSEIRATTKWTQVYDQFNLIDLMTKAKSELEKLRELLQEFDTAPTLTTSGGRVRAEVWADILDLVGR